MAYSVLDAENDRRRYGLTRFIYVLIDPRDGLIRYVGRTDFPKNRESQHVRLFRWEKRDDKHSAYLQWKRALFAEGHCPIFRIVDWELSGYRNGKIVRDRESKPEWWWIRYFAKRGYPLTNAVVAQRTPQKIVRQRKARGQ